MKKDVSGPVPWDLQLGEDLVARWSKYFGMLVSLKDVKFPRSFKPDNCNTDIKPDLAVFDDGNPDSFGAAAFGIWTLNTGTSANAQ